MAVVLFAMVSCKDEVEPYRAEATIPSESGGSATNFDDEDAKVIEKVFTDLASFITTFEETSKDPAEEKTPVVANGSLAFDAPDNKEALHIDATVVDEQPVPEANILYKDFAGTATLENNALRALISYSATINDVSAEYGIEITDFDLDEFVLSKDGKELAKDVPANTAEYYYASAVFFDCISRLEAEFKNASVKITTEDAVFDIDIAGSFRVGITGLNLDAFLGDDDGNPFTSAIFNINEMNLGIKVTFGGDTVNARVGMKNFNITVAFEDGEPVVVGTTTTTTNKVIIGFGYDMLSIFANYGDLIVLNVESSGDELAIDIVTTKVRDTEDYSKNSTTTKFDVNFTSRVGIGLKVNDNAIGLLTDLGINVKDKSFKELDLDKDLVITPRAALVNGKYVDPKQFYFCVRGIIESMDAAEAE